MATDVKAHITGTVWQIPAPAGTTVNEGDTIIILESMKMEMPIEAPCAGTVAEVRVKEAQAVTEGETVAIINES